MDLFSCNDGFHESRQGQAEVQRVIFQWRRPQIAKKMIEDEETKKRIEEELIKKQELKAEEKKAKEEERLEKLN